LFTAASDRRRVPATQTASLFTRIRIVT